MEKIWVQRLQTQWSLGAVPPMLGDFYHNNEILSIFYLKFSQAMWVILKHDKMLFVLRAD